METRFYRPLDNRFIGGVCAGVAEGLDLDPTFVRLLWVLVTFLGGSGVLIYLIAWVIMPDEDGARASLPIVILVLLVGLPLLCGLFFLVLAVVGSLIGMVAGMVA